MLLVFALWLLAMPGAPPVIGEGEAERQVAQAVEELRKGELLLDADFLEPLVAYSFTLVEGCQRISGRFAFLEPLRRLRAAGATVKRLHFQEIAIRVYGASAVVTYRYDRLVTGGPRPGRERGFTTDVFEKREDGAWILVHRHRVSPCRVTEGGER